MKIISGIYRGRKILFSDDKTRPLTTILRMTIFNILQNIRELEDTVVCDICAGTGSFGLESLSRGSKFVYFIEKSNKTATGIRNNLKHWNIVNAKVINKDILYSPKIVEKIDLIFLDPPFGHNIVEKILYNIKMRYIFDHNTIIIIRSDYKIKVDDAWLFILKIYHFSESILYFCSPRKI